MSDFFEIFSPGAAHWRRQRELELVYVDEAPAPSGGGKPLDLDGGVITITPRSGDAKTGGGASTPERAREPEAQAHRASDSRAWRRDGGASDPTRWATVKRPDNAQES